MLDATGKGTGTVTPAAKITVRKFRFRGRGPQRRHRDAEEPDPKMNPLPPLEGGRVLQQHHLDADPFEQDGPIAAARLHKDTRALLSRTPVVGQSPAVRRVLDQVQQVAATDSTVLLLGETGTGKELFATQIHELGPGGSAPWCGSTARPFRRALSRASCSAVRRAPSPARWRGRSGRFELAHGGTIFLDEIGDLPTDVQVKLLRVLEEGQIERLGSPQPRTVNVRIIAATHRDLER